MSLTGYRPFPAGGFPGHRSMAEVIETERLQAAWDRSPSERRAFARRLDKLLTKAWANNRPPTTSLGEMRHERLATD